MLGPGISGSALPFRRKAPAWTTMSPTNITDLIVRNAKKGLTPSQIGVLMRDAYGIPQVRFLTGKKILRILNKNRKDIDCKFRLVLSESRIHRLTRYYKRTGQ